MPQLRIRALAESDCVAWDAFVQAAPDATFFHLTKWRDLIVRHHRHRAHYLYAERGGQIVAILPLIEMRSAIFGHSLSSLPFAVYGGIVGQDVEGRKALEDHAADLARKLGVAHLEYRNVTTRHAEWPRQDLYVTFRKELAPDDEANLLAIPRKQRAMVRKGINAGLVSSQDTDVDRFFAVYADNVRRHGTPALSKAWFQALQEAFGDDCEVTTVCDGTGRALSSVLSFYFRDEVLPYYAGDIAQARDFAANDFKYWELMRRATGKGCRIFDYGRSKVGTGPYSFKKNWGFEPAPLSYEYVLLKRDSIPQNNPMNPKYRAFIAMWKRLPLAVTNVLGPRIVRSLG